MNSEDSKYKNLFMQSCAKYIYSYDPDSYKERFVQSFNRHHNQCLFLYELLNDDLQLYIELETAIKYLNIRYCPSDIYECQYIISCFRVKVGIEDICNSVK